MHEKHDQPNLPKKIPPLPEQIKTLDAQELFRGAREVCIDHAGVRYRLRITRKNRLILQK